MYFVDRKKIEEHLQFMGDCLETLENATFDESKKDMYSLERIAHMLVESMLDVGNSMIDGFIMRDPGSYEDIIDILEDEKVVPADHADQLKKVIALRKPLVQAYTRIDHSHVHQTLTENLDAMKAFPQQVRTYLTEELGPVSAFLPEE
ncbi:DUF86 domain-containing protein [Pseudalkalibacillus sp. SCS-8]|uniref:DUF86 domain-containing protein n=1 Tax=Pseudalkalibacillus nanhaiensis TaxID=3115291 RepID=UPI0032DBE505